jgi:hypothetical protein
MIALYGADSDCVTHKINDDIEVDVDNLKYMQAIVHARTGTLWVTYLSAFEQTLDECGDVAQTVYETEVWRGDIRRPNILRPRWVKLSYHRLTAFGMPPQSNNYRGTDNPLALHFAAQQPDMTDWNDDPSVTPDPLYPVVGLGGPRHYNYRFGVSTFDRDQVPAYNDECGDPLYAGDEGIGFIMVFRTPRYLPEGNMVDKSFAEIRLDYLVVKTHISPGLDRGYGRVWIDESILNPTFAAVFPTQPTWWPINDTTVEAPTTGGGAHEEWTLKHQDPSNGKSMQMEWTVIGRADRDVVSFSVEFRYWGCYYDVDTTKYNPED